MKQLLTLIVFLLSAITSQAATYYVRADGNDSNTGTADTAGGAWRNIYKAMNTVVAGDTINIRAGSYPGSSNMLRETTSGTAASRITYNCSPGVTITGSMEFTGNYITWNGGTLSPSTYNSSTNEAIDLSGSNIILSGMTITGYNVPDKSVKTTALTTHGTNIEVVDCVIHSMDDIDALHVWGTNVVFRRLEIYGLVQANYNLNHTDLWQTWGPKYGGMESSDIFFIDCYFHNNTCQLGHISDDGSALLHDWYFINCLFKDNSGTTFIGVPETRFINCVFDNVDDPDNFNAAITYYETDEYSHNGSEVRNCVFYNCGTGASGGGLNFPHGNSGVIATNNYQGTAAFGTKTAYVGTSSINGGNPQWTSQASANYTIASSSSVLINAGANLTSGSPAAVTIDRAGNARPATGGWEVGPYEFSSADTIAPALVSSTINAAGTLLTRVFSEAVNTSNADDAGWSISMGAAVTGTYLSGSGSTTIVYSLSRMVNPGESGTNSYTQPGNGVEDMALNDLPTTVPPAAGTTITNNSAAGQVETPVIGLPSGPYYGTQNITITCPTSGASIRYTTDGSTPTAGSTPYAGAVPVSSNLTLKAIGIKSGSTDSGVDTETYEITSWASGTLWKYFAVPTQTGFFTWRFRVTPSSAGSDTVVGMSPDSPVNEYTDMAMIIRFNSTNTIDVMNGAAYDAASTVSYSPGTAYDFVVSATIAPPSSTYSVTVTPSGGATSTLAASYAFRSTQSSTPELDTVGMITSLAGTATVTNMIIAADTTAPTPNPLTFLVSPTALDPFSVTMTASTATDALNNPVEYSFEETTGAAGATDSGWQTDPVFVDSGLSPSTQYTYRVKARDRALNEGANSSAASVTTPAQVTGASANCDTLNVTTLRVGP